MAEIKNARITSAPIRMDRGCFLTCGIDLSGEGWG